LVVGLNFCNGDCCNRNEKQQEFLFEWFQRELDTLTSETAAGEEYLAQLHVDFYPCLEVSKIRVKLRGSRGNAKNILYEHPAFYTAKDENYDYWPALMHVKRSEREWLEHNFLKVCAKGRYNIDLLDLLYVSHRSLTA
jgi:hypothetical protein